ncbi:TPA: hypothetical protein KD866_002386 [Vibrio parahaemolyticus]|nr:hypothetical protein [Vibrio parahaemolyticus]
MTQNIEERTLAATATMEGAAKAVDEIANTDKDVSTPVGMRKSFPKIAREADEGFNNQRQSHEQDFQTRWAISQQVIGWQPITLVSDSLQRYSVGVVGETGYKEYLPDPEKLPFTTSSSIADDLALDRWLENGVPSVNQLNQSDRSRQSAITEGVQVDINSGDSNIALPPGTNRVFFTSSEKASYWYAWDEVQGEVILDFTLMGDYGTATMTTDVGSFEFVSNRVLGLRNKNDIAGYGAIDGGDFTEALERAADTGRRVVCESQSSIAGPIRGYISRRITCSSYDLSNVILVVRYDFDPIGDNMSGGCVLRTWQDKTTKVISESILEGRTSAGSLAGNGNCVAYLNNPEVMYTRKVGENISTLPKQDVLYVDDNGYFRSTPVTKDFTGETTVTIIPDTVQPVDCYNPIIEFEIAPLKPIPALFVTSRNRVKQIGGMLKKSNLIADNTVLTNCFAKSFECGWATFERMNNSGPTGNYYYPVYFVRTVFCGLKESYAKEGWAMQDGEVCRHVVVSDCVGPRFGAHYDGYDFHYIRCFSNKRGFEPSGGGVCVLEDCGHIIDYTAAEVFRDCVKPRNDYGWCFDGKIKVKGRFLIRQIGLADGFPRFFKASKGYPGALANGKDVVKAPDLEVEELYFDNDELSIGNNAEFVGFLIDNEAQQSFEFPNVIDISQIKYSRGARYNQQSVKPVYLDATTDPKIVQKSVKVNVDKYINYVPNTYGFEASVPLLDRPNVRIDWDVKITNSEGFSAAISAPSSWSFVAENCDIIDWTGNRNLDRDESKTVIRHCKLTGTDFKNTGKSDGNWQYFYNEFTNGGAIELSDNIKVAQGNVVNVTSALSGTVLTAEQLFLGFKSSSNYH